MIFLDFEASSLFRGSTPVEVAWCSHDLTRGRSAIIRPCPGWSEWSPAAECLHGLSRAHLREHGMPALDVMLALNAALGDAACITDNPSHDWTWLRALSRGAGVAHTFAIDHVARDVVLAAAGKRAGVRPDDDLARSMAQSAGLARHRALDDCIVHALALSTVAVAQLVRDGRGDAATALREGMIGRAKALLAKHGRRP